MTPERRFEIAVQLTNLEDELVARDIDMTLGYRGESLVNLAEEICPGFDYFVYHRDWRPLIEKGTR